MIIKTQEIREVLDKMFTTLQERGVEELEIVNDYYWYIPTEEIYDPYNLPKNLNLGQLSDDWQDLVKIINKPRDPVMSDFSDMAAIFRVIGERDEF